MLWISNFVDHNVHTGVNVIGNTEWGELDGFNRIVFSWNLFEARCHDGSCRLLRNLDYLSSIKIVKYNRIDVSKRGEYFIVGEKLEIVRNGWRDLLQVELLEKEDVHDTKLLQIIGVQSALEIFCISRP